MTSLLSPLLHDEFYPHKQPRSSYSQSSSASRRADLTLAQRRILLAHREGKLVSFLKIATALVGDPLTSYCGNWLSTMKKKDDDDSCAVGGFFPP